MKTKLLLTSLLVAGWSLIGSAQETQTTKFSVNYDTWVTTGGNANRGNNNSLEIKRWVENSDAGEVAKNNIGLLGFNVSTPDGMKIKEATLYFVTERVKINPMNVYLYGNDFAESNSYEQEGSYVEESFATNPVQFTASGQNGKAIFDGVSEDYQNFEKWQNYVNVTPFVSGKIINGRINFMIACDQSINVGASNGNDVRIYTKENTNGADAFKQSDNTYKEHIDGEDLIPYLEITFVEDADSETTVFDCVADTWIRESNEGWKDGATKTNVEIRMDGDNRFAALYGFNYSLPANMEVQSATLHLITERHKGDKITVYGYSNDFDEYTTWGAEKGYIAEATGNESLAEFAPAAHWNKAIFDTGIDEDKRNLESWTNDIDVTQYVKSLGLDATRANFYLQGNSGNQICFYTKEATDVDAFAYEVEEDGMKNKYYYANFKASEVVPYLKVVFTKKHVTEVNSGDGEDTYATITEEGTIKVLSKKTTAKIHVTAPEGTKEVWYKDTPATEGISLQIEGYTLADNNNDGTHAITLTTAKGEGNKGTLEIKFIAEDDSELKTESYSYTAINEDPTGVELVVDGNEGVAEYFNLQGVKVLNPEKGNIYIKVVNGKALKVVK